LWAALSFLILVMVAAVVGVYAFDFYERAWGRGPSLQVISWVAVPVSALVALVAAIGFRLSKQALVRSRVAGTIVGSITALALVASEAMLPSYSEVSGYPLFIALVVLVLAAAILVPIALTRGAELLARW
jgi:hypothetical protein